MMLYAIKNGDGLWLRFDEYGDGDWYLAGDTWSDKSKADSCANDFRGRVVELVEKPEPVEVSEDEAEMLKAVKNGTWSARNMFPDVTIKTVNRLMRAYVNGWEVEKPKRWNVKVPHVNVGWYFINNAGNLSATYQPADAGQFTLDEIEHYGLGDCEKEEVTDDEQ